VEKIILERQALDGAYYKTKDKKDYSEGEK